MNGARNQRWAGGSRMAGAAAVAAVLGAAGMAVGQQTHSAGGVQWDPVYGAEAQHRMDARYGQGVGTGEVGIDRAGLYGDAYYGDVRYRADGRAQTAWHDDRRGWDERHGGREDRRVRARSLSYGDVNYDRDLGYGEFSYYGDPPNGRYLYRGASPDQEYLTYGVRGPGIDPRMQPTAQQDPWLRQQQLQQQQQMIGVRQDLRGQPGIQHQQDIYQQDIYLYDHQHLGAQPAGFRQQDVWYGDQVLHEHGRLPRTQVYFQDYQVHREARPGGQFTQPVGFDDPFLRQQQLDQQRQWQLEQQRLERQRIDQQMRMQQRGAIDDGRMHLGRRPDGVGFGTNGRWVSYGDVNYEGDLGYGEFSYYGDVPDGRYLHRGASPVAQPVAGPGMAPTQPVTYYTTDWYMDETRLDERLDRDIERERDRDRERDRAD